MSKFFAVILTRLGNCLVSAASLSLMIQTRLAEIERQRQRLNDELAGLHAEYQELKVAEHVLRRLAPKHATQEYQPELLTDDQTKKTLVLITPKGIPPKGSPRPRGIPSVPDMVAFVLREAEQQGKQGLTGRNHGSDQCTLVAGSRLEFNFADYSPSHPRWPRLQERR